ncbi:nuclear transport factor 2 family protein [Prescottella agglutinans]|uniref:Ketosteroid isomerase-like protein n=1 Tax=Prescottella agglutinans TaxID=1644129 RepID=A0ABT6ME95_9NOCA|nr:nuclear transport factor 2 family protein [Prescottella agglutinans]MDH6282647.1 ketosteroid isomerase-like protein [Prescottella agglutinans]
MTSHSDIAAALYRSLAAGDRNEILARLHPDFTGHTTAGLPLGLGGDYRGPEAMLRRFWGGIARAWIAAAHPTEFLPLGHDRLLVRGVYRGRGRQSGTEFEAEFIHILRFVDDCIIELAQLTDSAIWAHALEPARNMEDQQ